MSEQIVVVADAIEELAKRTIDGDGIRERREARDEIKTWCRQLRTMGAQIATK